MCHSVGCLTTAHRETQNTLWVHCIGFENLVAKENTARSPDLCNRTRSAAAEWRQLSRHVTPNNDAFFQQQSVQMRCWNPVMI